MSKIPPRPMDRAACLSRTAAWRVVVLLGAVAATAAAETRHVEGEVIVTFKASASLDSAKALLSRKSLAFSRYFGALSKKRSKQTGVVRDAGKSTAQLIAALKDDPAVETVEPNYLRWVRAAPNDTRFGEMWGMHNTGQTVAGVPGTAAADIRFVAARDMARAPQGEIVVGVLDTGLDGIHPELAPRLWLNPLETPFNNIDDDGNGYIDDLNGYDFTDDDADPADSGDHGTHVSGTIAALGDNQEGVIGVNDKARLLALKVSSDGDTISTSAVIEALQYATALRGRGVNLVALNASFGGGGFSSSERAAIQAAGDAGIILCAAAGNDSLNNDSTPNYPASYRLPNMIVVAASDQDDALSGFSNYGATTVDIAAPGTSILSTQPAAMPLTVGGTTYATNEMTYSGRTAGLTGAIVDCGIGNPGDFPAEVSGNIALIQRGTLTFADKVTNAMAAGATAAVIYNNVSGNFFGTLQTPGDWIPALSISQADGQAIKAALPMAGSIAAVARYQFLNGTSMATPHVAGAVAFAAMNHPEETMAQRRQRILASADVKASLQGKVITGGRLNLLRVADANDNGIADWVESMLIITTTLPPSIHGEAYSQQLNATGGVPPYIWTITSGALPAGFLLGSTGLITGTSSTSGSFPFTVEVGDSASHTSSQALILTTAATGPLDHFVWEYVPASAFAGHAFAVKLTARDSGGRIVTTSAGEVTLSAAPGAGVIPPVVTLQEGVFAGLVILTVAAEEVTLSAGNGTASGDSSLINVIDSTSTAADGIPDAWKAAHGLAVTTSIATLDHDGDGMSTLAEYLAGTDPRDPASLLKITSLSTDASSQFTLSFPAVAGKFYRVCGTGDLMIWTPLLHGILPTADGLQSLTVPLSGESRIFLRVEIVP